MKILYIVPSPPPKIPGTDGLFTEIGSLQKYFGGPVISLSPIRSLPTFIPVSFYGTQHLLELKKIKASIDVIHIFFPYLVDFYLLRSLYKPIIYTITSGVDPNILPSNKPPYSLVVSSEYEAGILKLHGYSKVHIIQPGIDRSQFLSMHSPSPDEEFVLLAGSAPWVRSQFVSKGYDLLLEALNRLPNMKLICLFRGTLYHEWRQKIQASGLVDRVEIINEKVDVGKILNRCHAAVVLASRPDLVKSYPNSLMEAIAAGRPVILSRAIPMSYYVEDTGCGSVVEELSVDNLTNSILKIINHYHTYTKSVENIRQSDLSLAMMIEHYRYLYRCNISVSE